MRKLEGLLIIITVYLAKQYFEIEINLNEYFVNDQTELDDDDDQFKNICVKDSTQFKKINEYNIKQYLKEFDEGGCTPLIILPGIFGTRLQILIECEVIQKENPKVFESCGWNSCDQEANIFYKLYKKIKIPQKEYSLWIPQINSPMSPLGLSLNESVCFNQLIELSIDENKEVLDVNDERRYKKYTSRVKGVEVKVFGETEETLANGECGDHAISKLLDYFQLIDCNFQGYKKLFEKLQWMGYQKGLSYQSLPYDFRVPSKFNKVILQLKRQVQKLYYLNGNKKVIILAHSYGNIQVLQSLNTLFDQEEKDKYILQYIGIGAPLAGTIKSSRALISGMYEYQKWGIGFNYISQQNMIQTTGLLLETMPMNYLHSQLQSPWMNAVFERIQHENYYIQSTSSNQTSSSSTNQTQSFQNSNFKWFPGPDQQCYQEITGEMNLKMCGLNMKDYNIDQKIIQINENNISSQGYKLNEMEKLIKDMGISDDLIDDCRRNNDVIQEMRFPGVNILMIMSSLYKTENKVEFNNKNPIDNSLINEVLTKPDIMHMSYGDLAVNNWSTLLGVLKWSYENEGQKSIRVAEFCSQYKKQLQDQPRPFNTDTNSSFFDLNKDNMYFGIDCSCNQKRNYDIHCAHSCSINNPQLVNFLQRTLLFYSQETNKQKINRNLFSYPYLNQFIKRFPFIKDYCYNFDIHSLL